MLKEHTTLQKALEAKKETWLVKATENQKEMTAKNIQAIMDTHFKENALNVDNKAIDFSLKNALGECTNLQDNLDQGPVVLTWYRGGWCPYCNITLQYLQNSLSQFKAQGATLIALTPELPDKSLSTTEKHNLEFQILSDVGNKVARQYGLVYKLIDALADVYKNKIGLNNYNGDNSNELPITATYVIDKNGVIQYAFLDSDYRKRADVSDILNALESL